MVVLGLLVAGCAQLPPRPDVAEERSTAPAMETALDRRIARLEDAHPGQSGFWLVSEGAEAYALRARSAKLAGRSLDVQTFIWWDDLTGMQLAREVLAAADRGVRVRLLVDDANARTRKYAFASLDAHPRIELRMFNPFASRRGKASLVIEGVGDFNRINRRMHNKSWIADNRIALVGGRNLGDEYFDAGEDFNFADLDLAMVGPVVREVSASFDDYWNSPLAYPMSTLAPRHARPEALAMLRNKLASARATARTHPFAEVLDDHEGVERLLSGNEPLDWSPSVRFAADHPLKAAGANEGLKGSEVLGVLYPMMVATREGITVFSPYFVPGSGATTMLVELARSGKRVRVLTNSLAATDVAAVHGGYARYRPALIEGGVQLWEFKPTAEGVARRSRFGSSSASLHTKAVVIDGSMTFVGSKNLDPRSASLNSELGVFVEHAGLARRLEALFEANVSGERAWAVTLDDSTLQWRDGTGTRGSEPQASLGRRFIAWLARWLPVRSQL